MAASGAEFLAETRQRLDAVFTAWSGGADVSPGDSLRLEGFMQAGIALGLATREQLQACMAESCLRCLGRSLDEPFPPMADPSILPLPPLMRRAPVVPSTRD